MAEKQKPAAGEHYHYCSWCHQREEYPCDWPASEGCDWTAPGGDKRDKYSGYCCQECYNHDPSRYMVYADSKEE
jgi:hypothetical protein